MSVKYILYVVGLALSFPSYAQVMNGSFEEWTMLDGENLLENWEVDSRYDCQYEKSVIFQDSDAIDGLYSLKLTGTCVFIEGGLNPTSVVQEVAINKDFPLPEHFFFKYKLLDIGQSEVNISLDKIGCAFVLIEYLQADQFLEYSIWDLRTESEVIDWTEVRLETPVLDFAPDRVKVSIVGGSCQSEGPGFIGNSTFLIDGFGASIATSTEVVLEDQIEIYPNLVQNNLEVTNAENTLMQVYSMDGKLIKAYNIKANTTTLSLEGVNKGLLECVFVDRSGRLLKSIRVVKL